MSRPSDLSSEFADPIFLPARFPIQLGLPDGNQANQTIRDAARAVQQETRADQFVAGVNQVLANNLYVAMTRARSLLAIYSQAIENGFNPASHSINSVLESCIKALHSTSDVEDAVSRQDDFRDILEIIGHQHRTWLRLIWNTCEIIQEPIFDSENKIIAEPLFWFMKGGRKHACFAPEAAAMSDEQVRHIQRGELVKLDIGDWSNR